MITTKDIAGLSIASSNAEPPQEWAIFPCHSIVQGRCSCLRTNCESPGKHPRTPNGLRDATADRQQLEAWWGRSPDANLAIATGEINNLVVVDIDPAKGGSESLLQIEEQHGRFPETVEVETGGQGVHLYYRYPPGVKISSRNAWRPGIDIKANGGYVLAPPSNHISGGTYRYAEGAAPGQVDIAPLPAWLLELLPQQPASAPTPRVNNRFESSSNSDGLLRRASAYVAKAEAVCEGNRDNTAFRLAGNLAAFSDNGSRLGATQIVELLRPWNARNHPALSDSQLEKCVTSALRNGQPRETKGTNGWAGPTSSRHGPPEEITYQRITSAELDSGNYQLDFLIENTLVAGQPLIVAGPMKVLKTSFLIDAAVSLATGGYFLGRFSVKCPCHVAVMTAESGLATIQETARRICAAAGLQLKDCERLIWSPDLPRFGNLDHLNAVERFLAADGIEVLFLDPAYLAMPAADAANLMAQGELLRSMSELCQKMGVTLAIAHHTKRNTGRDPYEPLELQDIAWAGFAEFARQWWLVNRREKYEPGTGDHRLWLSVGGSAGHSALLAVDVEEGLFGSRSWDVTLTDAAGAREEAEKRKQKFKQEDLAQKLDGDRKSICQALAGMPDDAGTKTSIKDNTGLNSTRLNAALASLLQDKTLISTTLTKGNNRSYDGYQLNQTG